MRKKTAIGCVLMLILIGGSAWGASLVAHYSFDDPANLTADASGNGHTLSVFPGYGTPGYSAEGKTGGASVFNGSTEGWIINDNIYPAGSFSFAAWVKMQGASTMIASPWSLQNGFNVYIAAGTYRFLTYYDSTLYNYSVSKVSPVSNEWQHIAMTYEVTGGPDATGTYTGTMKGYINGVLVTTLAGAQYDAQSANDMAIGRRSTASFNGLMDEIYVCSGALTDSEIKDLAEMVLPVLTKDASVLRNPNIKTDRQDAVYELNAPAKFIITAPDTGNLEYMLSIDGKIVLNKKTVVGGDNAIEIESTLERPGFLRCDVSYVPRQGGEKKRITACAAFAPDKIAPAQNHMPADFDSFWQGKKQALAAIPMDFSMGSISSLDPGVQMYDINVPCVGQPVRGYYGTPVGAETGKCPAIVFFQGAGVSSATQGRVIDYCKEGFIALEINAHGIPNGQSADYYLDLKNTVLDGYPYFGRENPDDCYFTGMFLRVFRALEFIKSRPEWDGRNLVVYGSSQGGAQAIAGAGLDPDVTFLVAGVPAMCDHGGEICGWPKLIPVEGDGSYNLQVLNTSRYVDCVNFASRTAAAAFFTVGFIDPTCRPTSVYAMYNTYGGPKEIVNMPLMSHLFPVENAAAAKSRVLASLTGPTGDQGGFIFYIVSPGREL